MKKSVALVGLVSGLVVLAGCSGSGASTASPMRSIATVPTPSRVTASPSVVPSPTAAELTPRPLGMGTLAAGRYRTNAFEPTLVFTLPDGWSQFFADDVDEIYMGGPDAELAISRAAQVIDPVSRGRVEAPEDLAEWFTQHPAFDTPAPVAIQVAGTQSHYLDLAPPSADTKIFNFPGGDFHIPPGIATRIYVVPLAGADISIVVLPKEGGGTIAAATSAAMPIVESLEIVP